MAHELCTLRRSELGIHSGEPLRVEQGAGRGIVLVMTSTTPHTRPPTTLTARCPEDVLAVVPVLLGFLPSDSVVMLTFGAVQAFHARVDRPDRTEDVVATVHSLLAPARRHRVQRVVFVIYGEGDDLSDQIGDTLHDEFSRAGINIVELLRADGERWFPMLHDSEDDHDDVARRGVPYDISTHPFLAHAVLRGQVTHGSREALAASVAVDPDRAARVAHLVAASNQSCLTVDAAVADVVAEGEWVQSLVSEQTAAGVLPTDSEAARLLGSLQVRTVRDAAWSTMTRVNAEEHVSYWTDVCRRTPIELLAPPATLLGWAAWQAGHGALAWCAVDLAAEGDPDYTLARYLAHALEQAVPPTVWESGWDWKEGLDLGHH